MPFPCLIKRLRDDVCILKILRVDERVRLIEMVKDPTHLSLPKRPSGLAIISQALTKGTIVSIDPKDVQRERMWEKV